MPRAHFPSHAEVTNFFKSLLPPAIGAKEIPFLFHVPRDPHYRPDKRVVERVVLSITPTPGFYAAVNESDRGHPPVCFLHRPWYIDRRMLRRGSLVLASHAAFDERLTVGWNFALGRRLGLDVGDAVCIRGYKDNPDRKIGLVARLNESAVLDDLVRLLQSEYSGIGELFTSGVDDIALWEVDVIAIMNAFHADEISRVLDAVHGRGWIDDAADGKKVLYLTGAARDYGLEAIAKVGMSAFCVGHRACEEWGIRYLAEELKSNWPVLDVVEVLEEEDAKPSNRPFRTGNDEKQQISGHETQG